MESSLQQEIDSLNVGNHKDTEHVDIHEIIVKALEVEPKVSFRAARDIKEGQPLTLSYVDSADVLVRRKELKSVYHFDCMCPRCIRELENSNNNKT